MPEIRANGISFNYTVSGPGDGKDGAPWVTFSHSHATDLTLWRQQAARLAGDFRVLCYDVRGHGQTEATQAPYSMDSLVEDVIALWDALGIERSHFVGLSLGGTTGMGIAIHHPDRIGGLVACNCHGIAHDRFREAWEPRIDLARTEGMEALVESTIGRWFDDAMRAAMPDTVAEVSAMIRNTSVEGYIGGARALQGIDYLGRFGDIAAPTLFVAGAQDQGAAPDGVRALHEALPGSEFVLLDPAGHLSNLQNAVGFEAALVDFLARV